ncbi:MAG: glycosyltransferase family 4 protein [Bacteroidales bacterium]|jgi:glycosyltransferase involved in cell wall biosynthesis|nr:glycosyltransferase family 4 protein [Bacteroidales bacterium]
MKDKIICATTVPLSLDIFWNGMLKELSKKYEVVAVSSPERELDIVREREGVRTIAVSMSRHISLFNDCKSLWNLFRVFRKEKPRMVHSMTPKAGLLCMIAAWLARVPVRVHTFTGLVFPTATGFTKSVLMTTDWLTCACATHIIPEGEGVKNDLLNNGITKKPLKVLGYGNVRGIDLVRYDRTKEVEESAAKIRKDGVVTFVAVGRLVGDKGINEMVMAFDRLNKENPLTRLILVGPEERELDPLKQEVLDLISKSPAIEAVGMQSDVRPWFAASDVAILASYREGFPNVVIEAGAMGLPQIVTDINGAREIIEDGKNGIVIPSKNTDALYEAMKKMMNVEYRNFLAKESREMIACRYEQSFVRNCLYDFYDSIMN